MSPRIFHWTIIKNLISKILNWNVFVVSMLIIVETQGHSVRHLKLPQCMRKYKIEKWEENERKLVFVNGILHEINRILHG